MRWRKIKQNLMQKGETICSSGGRFQIPSYNLSQVCSIFGALTIDVIAKSAFGIDVDAQNDRDCLFYRYAREIFDFRYGDPRMLLIGNDY